MPLKTYRPTTPGRRIAAHPSFEELTTSRPEKALVAPLKRSGGRNVRGKITVRHRGGGAKRAYRIIDFKRNNPGVPGKVATIEYDPNRSTRIALIHYADGDKRYILCPHLPPSLFWEYFHAIEARLPGVRGFPLRAF